MKKLDPRRFHVPLMFNYKTGQPVYYYIDKINNSFEKTIARNATINAGIKVMSS